MSNEHVADQIARIERSLVPAHLRRADGGALSMLGERMAHYHVPAVSIAVVENSDLHWARAYGDAAADNPCPVSTASLFQAASISKPVTTLAVLRLVARGVLDLDADVNSYLTGWQVPGTASWQPRVSLRQLLSHTAGVTVDSFPGYPHGQSRPTLLQVLAGHEPANTAPVTVDALPGAAFRYSGGGYCIVQHLLEACTGAPFPVLMRELVLDPLGMADSTFEQPLPPERDTLAACAHRSGAQPIRRGSHVYPEMAAAGLWTTASDLARFLVALQAAYAGARDSVVPQELAQEMLSPQVDDVIDLGMPLGGIGEGKHLGSIGLGIFLDGVGGAARMGHGGINEGFRCHMIGDIAGGQGAVVLTNSDDGAPLMMEIVEAIAHEYSWPAYPRPILPRINLPSAALQRFAGVYILRPGFTMAILERADGLWLQATHQQPIPLVATSDTTFVSEVVPMELSFPHDEDGGPTTLEVRQSTGILRARRQN